MEAPRGPHGLRLQGGALPPPHGPPGRLAGGELHLRVHGGGVCEGDPPLPPKAGEPGAWPLTQPPALDPPGGWLGSEVGVGQPGPAPPSALALVLTLFLVWSSPW